MKDKEIAKLKDERKLLLKSRRENRETSKQPEIKVDKVSLLYAYDIVLTLNALGSLSISVRATR